MKPTVIIGTNGTSIMELAMRMISAANIDEWSRAKDYALRIEKLAQECANFCDEQEEKEE